MQQILANTGNVTDATFLTDADGTVTFTATDATGTVIQTGSATKTPSSTGKYQFIVQPQSPSQLTVTWTGLFNAVSNTLTTSVEVVGSALFTAAEARLFDNAALASESVYPDDAINSEQVRIGAELEAWTARSWISRYCRLELAGNGKRKLSAFDGHPRISDGTLLQRPGLTRDISSIRSVTVSGAAVDATNIVVTGGQFTRLDGSWPTAPLSDPLNVVVEFEYGLNGTEEGVDRIALLLLRERLVKSKLDSRTTSISDELGTMRFVTPGQRGVLTMIPEVNSWLMNRRPWGI